MKLLKISTGLMVLLLLSLPKLGFSQGNVVANVGVALKTGSARELIQYFNNVVELKIDGESSNYSRTQAEYVLKEFFKKNEVVGFEYVFEGNSREGLQYAIGTYTHKSGSHRVYILFKKVGDALLIDTLDFTKE
ncbi:MAG: DUF4783 domain-containing protein [Bacteroidetes bacterium]|nr:DUF4783 domain-containing protein [Bacteroidota bacterium]MDA1121709.1 DUF4783 domain-containing protein [Bacteroidota bacterium]